MMISSAIICSRCSRVQRATTYQTNHAKNNAATTCIDQCTAPVVWINRHTTATPAIEPR
jgi:hypothetical protein